MYLGGGPIQEDQNHAAQSFQDPYVSRAAPWVDLGASASLCNNVMGVT